MKTVEFTLYEILGYIFPGAVMMLGIYALLWNFMPSPEQNWDSLSGWEWGALLAIAYVVGHSVQAVTNFKIVNWKSARSEFPSDLQSILGIRAKESVGLSPSASLKDKFVRKIAEHVVMQRGKTETRDIYIYREGYYRGMTFALFVFACGVLIHIFDSEMTLRAFGPTLNFAPSARASIGVIALVVAYLYFKRYQRFLRYRRNYDIYTFLVISSKSPPGAGPSTK